jgi:hypothetical protein
MRTAAGYKNAEWVFRGAGGRRVRNMVYGGVVGLLLSGGPVLAGVAAAQTQPGADVQVETITPEAACRPLTFQDWCEGIKNLGAERCNQRLPDDVRGYEEAKRHLRIMAIKPNASLGCNANASVNPTRDWVGSRGCNPITEPPPDTQPFAGPR